MIRGGILLMALYLGLMPTMAQSSTDKLQVLTWNVFLRPRHLFWQDAQLRRAHDIVDALLPETFDVLVFQESFDKHSTNILIEGLKGTYPYVVRPVRKNPFNLTSGVLILSKYPIEKQESIMYKGCAGFDCMADKGAVLVQLTKGDQSYQIVGTHAQAEVGKRYQVIRAEQYAHIRSGLLEKYRTEGIPQIIVGDMNTECVDEADAYADMLGQLDVVDGDVLLPEGDLNMTGEPYTWGCRNNDLIPDAYKGKTALLDYALIRPNGRLPRFVRRSLQVFRRPAKKSGGKRHLSDHYALSMTIGY